MTNQVEIDTPEQRGVLGTRTVNTVRVLDHGYIKVVEHWGSDQTIVESARMSTQKGFEGWGPVRFCPDHSDQVSIAPGYPNGGSPLWACPQCGKWTERPGDERLLRYLWKNQHSTPFEMAGVTFEVQAPLFVLREWHRHRVPFGYSEASARYALLPAFDYLPSTERLFEGGGHLTKQAGTQSDALPLNDERAQGFLQALEGWQQLGETIYQQALGNGVPRELARLAMSVGRYTRMRATGNLRGWLAFCALRRPANAQKEIRVYADEAQLAFVQAVARAFAGTRFKPIEMLTQGVTDGPHKHTAIIAMEFRDLLESPPLEDFFPRFAACCDPRFHLRKWRSKKARSFFLPLGA